MKKRIFKKSYKGFESVTDIDEDLIHAMNQEPELAGDFQGTLTITLEYEKKSKQPTKKPTQRSTKKGTNKDGKKKHPAKSHH